MQSSRSQVGSSSFGWHVSIPSQRLSRVSRELNWDAELSLQRVEHVPVGVSGSAVVSRFRQFLLEHPNLGHGLVNIADFRLDQMNWVIHGVPNSWVSESILRRPPVIPGQDDVVNRVLDVRDQIQGQLLPALVFIVVVGKDIIELSDLGVDRGDILGVGPHVKHSVDGDGAIEHYLFGVFVAFFTIAAGVFGIGLRVDLSEFWLSTCWSIFWSWHDRDSGDLVLNSLELFTRCEEHCYC